MLNMGDKDQPGIRAVQLKSEYLPDPIGIDVESPRLSWVLEAGGRGKSQSAYRVLVSETEEELAQNRGTLWDSGKVSSDQTLNIVYRGETLRSSIRCWWKVRVWDEEDMPSEYSEPTFWEMGLLRASDWGAKWIGLGSSSEDAVEPPEGEFDDVLLGLSPSPYLRKTFDVGKTVRRARVYATARGVYELWLNGSRVGDEVLAPGWTDYNKRLQYQTYDVTEMLASGRNVIGGILGDGWFCGFFGMDPKHRGAHYGTRPQLMLQMHLEYQDGTEQSIISDGSWNSSTGPIVFSDLLMGETYDAREEMTGWDQPGFDDEKWCPVSLEDSGEAPLVAEPAQPIKITQEVEAKAITQPEEGVYVFDFGQNVVGWVRLEVRGTSGTQVRLRFAEAVNPDGTVYTKNLRAARQTDTYILKGDGIESFEPHFTFHGFRYVEVVGFPGEPSTKAVTARVAHSDAPFTGTFECSNPLVNQLQNNIVWGQRGNVLSVPTDCPQRDERLGWMGDAQVFARTACFNMDLSAFFAKWMVDVEDAQSPEGGFPDVAPRLANLSDGAPAWGDAGIIIPWTVYRNYGDTRIVKRHYNAMSRWMDYIHEANPDLLRTSRLNNNFGDWLSPAKDETPKDLLATAYWAYDAKLMAEMAEATGRFADAKGYEELFRGIREAFVEAYVSDSGRIKGDTQTCYALALHMRLLPDALRSSAADHLVRTIAEEDWHLSTGFVGVSYLCPVLSEVGRTDVAYRLLMNETFPSWGYTIAQGATTIWERWDGWTEGGGFQSPIMNSFNHYSLGSVGEWLYRYVAGIGLETPGYGSISIRPHPGGGLTWARGEYESVRGRIVSDWQIEADKFRLLVEIPANTSASVYLPARDVGCVSEAGSQVDQVEGVNLASVGEEGTKLSIGSGRYEFSVEGPML